jgi:hypothetical protein
LLIDHRKVALVLCVLALIWVGLKVILPLFLSYTMGVGVEMPLPKSFAMAYPKLAIWLFLLGGPTLFLALLGIMVWLAVSLLRD